MNNRAQELTLIYFFKGVHERLRKLKESYLTLAERQPECDGSEIDFMEHISNYAAVVQEVLDLHAEAPAPGVELYELVEDIAAVYFVTMGLRGELSHFKEEFEAAAELWYQEANA